MSANHNDIFDTRTPEQQRLEAKRERQRRTRAQAKCEMCGNCLPMIRVDPDRMVCGTCIDKEEAAQLAQEAEEQARDDDISREVVFDKIEASIVRADSLEDLKTAVLSLLYYARKSR